MTTVLLAPDLPLEHWPSMDRYASRLLKGLRTEATDLRIDLAGEIGRLTEVERAGPSGQGSDPTLSRISDLGLREVRRYYQRYRTYPAKVRRAPGDVLHVLDHSYGHLLLGDRRRPAVTTVHDLLPLLTVRRGARGPRARLRNQLLRRVLEGVRRSDHWITSTTWLQAELSEWLGRDDAISVIPFGIDEGFFTPQPTDRETLRERWDLPHDGFVVLHVGSVGERKNLPTILESVLGLRNTGLDAWLLQLGAIFTAGQLERIETIGLAPFVRATGPVSESLLRAAYHAADALLFPSLYEGFGFPVLEAMASGLPVVTSGAGGLAEAAGDAAAIVTERTTEPYVEALRRIAEDDAWRAHLVARGLAHAQRFRWAETARRTAEVYRHLVQ